MSSPEGSTVTFRRVPRGVRPLALRRFARLLEHEVAGGRAFDCLVTGDAELRRLNREFRGKDYATDVLSFPACSMKPSSLPRGRPRGEAESTEKEQRKTFRGGNQESRLGDIAISLGRARVQARVYGHEPESEIRILMLHGLLHLLGMDHESSAGERNGRMARAEERWRTRLRLPEGLIERAWR